MTLEAKLAEIVGAKLAPEIVGAKLAAEIVGAKLARDER
jgi:hypothetical protein